MAKTNQNNSSVKNSFEKIFGGSQQSGPTLADLDRQFSYQGVQYGDLPSYKVGQKGGSLGLDRLAMMMGGQIYNPYQFARMTSSGGASGEYPYKSALSQQEAGQAAGLQSMKARQDLAMQGFASRQDLEKLALASGFSSIEAMQRYARQKQSGLLRA